MNREKTQCIPCANPNCHSCDKDEFTCSDCKETFWGLNCASKVEGCAKIDQNNGECKICQTSHYMEKTGLCVEGASVFGLWAFIGLFSAFYLIF